jgi:sulfocyanin
MRSRTAFVVAVLVVAAAVAVSLMAGVPGGAATSAAFSIVAGQTPANGGLNFDGTDRGHLVITVPVGARVQLTLVNKGDLPHSLQVIPYTTAMPAAALPHPAFPGAETPNPQAGVAKGKSAVAKFVASKPGKYLFICGFPGHALLGMYGIINVSPSASARPSLVTTK